MPSLEELIAARDYVGAITVLNFKRQGSKSDVKLTEWLAYAYYHHGEHDKVGTAAAALIVCRSKWNIHALRQASSS